MDKKLSWKNHNAHGTYNINNQIKFKTSLLKSSLCDAYILVSPNIIVLNTGTAANPNNGKNMLIKNCAPFTDCVIKINNTQIDNAKDIHIVQPLYNLIKYSDSYSKTSASLLQYYRRWIIF